MGSVSFLFNRKILNRYLSAFSSKDIPNYEDKRKKIMEWAGLADYFLRIKEKSVQGKFLTSIFEDILGYSTFLAGREYNLTIEQTSLLDGTEADGALGFFTPESRQVHVVIELKDATTHLDKKQSGRNNQTPIEQGFSYAHKNGPACGWVIVSNFREIRLYKSSSSLNYEAFHIAKLGDEAEFKRFYALLCKTNLIHRDGKSLVDKLYSENEQARADISKEFYSKYKKFRTDLFLSLKANNTGVSELELFQKAQKVLDRIIFICFCENAFLLPPGIFKRAIETGKNSLVRKEHRIWEQLAGLFDSIDKGNPPLKINGYNGGLFRNDPVLDALTVPDEPLEQFIELLEYDFGSDLNVNILGHIFEQSIADLEQLKAEIDGAVHERKRSKRRSDGIYYTPHYITHYIVKQALEYWQSEKRNFIGLDALPKLQESDFRSIKIVKGKIAHNENIEAHIKAWSAFKEILSDIKVLDPACGSGAFLNEAFDQLWDAGQVANDELVRISKGKVNPKTIAVQAKNQILANNIYGVDLNEESVEITKLALWLRTAKRDQPLENLDENIKCGNSLIDDPRIAGKKAFDWRKEFKAVIDDGGFDIVVGNPPYANIDIFGHGSPVFDHLRVAYPDIYMDKSDILFYFINKAIDLLKDGGILGFIVSNAFLFSDKAKKLRNYILEKCSILEIVNFEKYLVFPGAGITTCILILQKGKHVPKASVYSFKGKEYFEETVIDYLNGRLGFFDASFAKDTPFALVNDGIARLNNKIDAGHRQLGEILHVGKGMETAADDIFSISKHKKLGEIFVLGQGMQTAADDIFSFNEHPDEFPKKYVKKRISGKNIGRYSISGDSEYVLYFEDVEKFEDLPISIQSHLNKHADILKKRATVSYEGRPWWRYSRPMHKEYYHLPKLICSRRAFDNIFVFDGSFEYMCFSNMTAIFCTNDAYLPEFVLALLNSKLLNFRYKSIGKQTGGGSFEYFPNGLQKLPIADATPAQQESIAQKAIEMIKANKELQKKLSSALHYLKSTFNANKLSQSLDRLHALNNIEFLEELAKSKIQTKMVQEQKLLDWFEQTKSDMMAVNDKIQTLDRVIDKEVYSLYGLTDAEIAAIEEDS